MFSSEPDLGMTSSSWWEGHSLSMSLDNKPVGFFLWDEQRSLTLGLGVVDKEPFHGNTGSLLLNVSFSIGRNQTPQADLANPTAIESFVAISPEGSLPLIGFWRSPLSQVQFGTPIGG